MSLTLLIVWRCSFNHFLFLDISLFSEEFADTELHYDARHQVF